MRVIAGYAKGRQIKAPKGGEKTRPTADKVREAIFGSLQFEVSGSRVLDLFAGSGAMGIEALSRGAKSAVFVDADRSAINLIKENLRALEMTGSAQIYQMDYAAALQRLTGQFDFIFLDPPYRAGFYQPAIALIEKQGLLGPGGKIVVEHEQDASFDRSRAVKERKYGRTQVTFISLGAEREITISRQF